MMELGDEYFAAEEAKLDSKRKVKDEDDEGGEGEEYMNVKQEEEEEVVGEESNPISQSPGK